MSLLGQEGLGTPENTVIVQKEQESVWCLRIEERINHDDKYEPVLHVVYVCM